MAIPYKSEIKLKTLLDPEGNIVYQTGGMAYNQIGNLTKGTEIKGSYINVVSSSSFKIRNKKDEFWLSYEETGITGETKNLLLGSSMLSQVSIKAGDNMNIVGSTISISGPTPLIGGNINIGSSKDTIGINSSFASIQSDGKISIGNSAPSGEVSISSSNDLSLSSTFGSVKIKDGVVQSGVTIDLGSTKNVGADFATKYRKIEFLVYWTSSMYGGSNYTYVTVPTSSWWFGDKLGQQTNMGCKGYSALYTGTGTDSDLGVFEVVISDNGNVTTAIRNYNGTYPQFGIASAIGILKK